MTTSTLPEEPDSCIYRRVFRGHPDQIGEVRQFLRTHLAGHPSATDVVLVASELTTNACEHPHTGRSGGTFTVEARQRPDSTIRLEVHDNGGPTAFGETSMHKEGGRGLSIVTALTTAWGVNGDAAGRTVWAEFKP